MFQTPLPDLGSRRSIMWTAAVVSLAVALVLAGLYGPHLASGLGDTDDAMRMALVRDLLHGRGWYDQSVIRLQPPLGSVMHWSRLVDGALAGLTMLLQPLLGVARAELGARLIWPLLWVAPLVLAALVLARRLGSGLAVLPAAVLMAVGFPLYAQFAPGRVDHHNIQIALCLVAAAAAAEGRARSAVLAGSAVACGLAVGLEAVLFDAVIAAGVGSRFVFMQHGRRPAMAFGLSLAAASGAVFLTQTPPARWGVAPCDAMGANLALGLMMGGLGLAAAAWVCRSPSPALRASAVGATGALALAAYLVMDPHCLHGPMAEIDPRLYPIWLGHVRELMAWPQLWGRYPDHVVLGVANVVLGVTALSYGLADRSRRYDFAWLLVGALFLLAGLLAALAARMESYLLWFAVPLLASAVAELTRTRMRGALVPALALALAVSTAPLNALAQTLFARQLAAVGAVNQADHCYDTQAYRRLAELTPGLVLSEIDLGPFILANTPHAILNAPYHRMSWGILGAHDVLSTASVAALPKARALNIAYVMACPAHAQLVNHLSAPPGSLLRELDRGAPPSWLYPLSGPGEALQVYKVR